MMGGGGGGLSIFLSLILSMILVVGEFFSFCVFCSWGFYSIPSRYLGFSPSLCII